MQSRIDAKPDDRPTISVVIPLYNEQETLPELYRRLTNSLEPLQLSYEILFVNDGSVDRTEQIIDELRNDDPRVVVVHFSRNFGHQPAVSAGLEFARGQAAIIMDGDLQDPPEVIPDLIDIWKQGAQVIYTVRRARKENLPKRLCYASFYRLLRAISDLDIPLDSGDFCLMDRVVVDSINRLPEQLRFVRGLRSFVGFRQVGYQYERAARGGGRPKYTFRTLFALAVQGLVSFSGYPLRLVAYLGAASACIAILITVWIGIDAVYTHTAPRGWASTIVVVLFMASVQLISLGIIGEYIRCIFLESKGRPPYVVRAVKIRTAGEQAARTLRQPAERRVEPSPWTGMND